ncbi:MULTISPECIES: flavin reductase family protein [unclassified Streptomyces]|uniref:flavin reductase family protein n=1 Tax=unclassified Streptomyces TaxID=2593676 RepID=UPI00278C7245|nr:MULTISPECIES: flavin reductase family protein [unclassified Streptomyces]
MERLSATGTLEGIDPGEYRDTLSRFASGVTVVAGLDEAGAPAGLACQSFTSLSLDPPLVLVCVARTSTSWARIAPTGRFGISVLAEDQRTLCRTLGSRRPDKFTDIDWHTGRDGGSVLLADALAHLECTLERTVDGGDHKIVIGRVTSLTTPRADGRPLLFFRSAFGTGRFPAGQETVDHFAQWL